MKRGLNFLGVRDTRGQETMSLPFGIIFAILLIVVFIMIAGIAVYHFINVANCGKSGKFYGGLQNQVDNVWHSQLSDNVTFNIDLPSDAKKVCFVNLSKAITDEDDYIQFGNRIPGRNTFIIPAGSSCNMPSYELADIDIEKITQTQNPYCVNVSKDLKIKKDFYDKYVTIE